MDGQAVDCLAVVSNYQKDAERTSATASLAGCNAVVSRLDDTQVIRLLHGAMGLCTEAGELQDQLKKHIFYGKPLDVVNIAEECGDLFWYLAETLTAIDARFIDVMHRNIEKLRARYPEKFTEDKAINRDLDAERAVLEK
jgi:NTP pyrophosphatase (non-canonical NTP hydrolase)